MLRMATLVLFLLWNLPVRAFCPTEHKPPSRYPPTPAFGVGHSSMTSLGVGAWEANTAVTFVDEFFRTQPFLSAFLTCGIKASAADYLAQLNPSEDAEASAETPRDRWSMQRSQENAAEVVQQNINLPRNLAFLLYGGLYQGMFLQLLYMSVYPTLYGESAFRIPLCIFSDICAFGPFVTLPVAYVLRALIEHQAFLAKDDINASGRKYSGIKGTVEDALSKYQDHVLTQNLLIKYWSVWAPAQTINWLFIPEHFRVVYVAFVSFFWVYLLSAISSQESNTLGVAANKEQAKQNTTLGNRLGAQSI